MVVVMEERATEDQIQRVVAHEEIKARLEVRNSFHCFLKILDCITDLSHTEVCVSNISTYSVHRRFLILSHLVKRHFVHPDSGWILLLAIVNIPHVDPETAGEGVTSLRC